MSSEGDIRKLPYKARARLADNLLLQRTRAGYSQERLGERAMVSVNRVGELENGRIGLLDTYVRLAGAMSISLNDLLAGVVWMPAVVERAQEAGYKVHLSFERTAASGKQTTASSRRGPSKGGIE